MATTTIHHLKYQMTVGNARFNAGMNATRGELRMSKKIMAEMRGPVDRLEQELAELHQIYAKGLITVDAYTRKKRELNKEMRKSKGAGAAFRGFLSQNKLAIAGMAGAAVAAIAGIEKMRSLTNEQFGKLDELAKKSDEIGISPDMLEKLRAVTELTSTMDVNAFDTALRKMAVRISQAAVGTGEARDSLAELNLNAEELNQLSPDKQYLRIADAIKQVTSESDQARLITKIFDDEAVALSNTLRLGSEEIMAQTDHIKGHSRESLAMIESSNDAWTKLGQTTTGFFQDMAVEFAPQVELLGNKLIEIMQDDAFRMMLESAFEMAKLVFPVFEVGLNAFLSFTNDLISRWLRIRALWEEFKGDSRDANRLANEAAEFERRSKDYASRTSTDFSQYDQRVSSIRQAAERRAEQIAERQARAAEASAAANQSTAQAVNKIARSQKPTNAGSF